MNLGGPQKQPDPEGSGKSDNKLSMPGRSNYLFGFSNLLEHKREARLVVQNFMKQLLDECESESSNCGIILDQLGEAKKAQSFLQNHWPGLLISGIDFSEQNNNQNENSSASNLPEHSSKINKKSVIEEHFPDLSCIVLAVGVMPDARTVYFLALHRADKRDLCLPINLPNGLDFKNCAFHSHVGLIGLLVTVDEDFESNSEEWIVDQFPYINSTSSEIHLASLAGGEITTLLRDMAIYQYDWDLVSPNSAQVLCARILEQGNKVEAYVLLSEYSKLDELLDSDGNPSELSCNNNLGRMRVVFGYSEFGLFNILECDYFPQNTELALYKARIAENPENTKDERNSEPALDIPLLEQALPGEDVEHIENNFSYMSCLDVLHYELSKLGFGKRLTDQEVNESELALNSCNISLNLLLDSFNEPFKKTSISACVFEKSNPEDIIYECIVVLNSDLLTPRYKGQPLPVNFLINVKIDNQSKKIKAQMVGIQNDAMLIAEQLREIAANSENLAYNVIYSLLTASIKKTDNQNFPLITEIGISCPIISEPEILKIPICIYDPNSKTIYNKTVNWHTGSGIIAIGSFFPWQGISGEDGFDNSSASFWINQ